MKRYSLLVLASLGLMLTIGACSAPKKPLPELTYTGQEPRVQNPLSPEESQAHIQVPKGFEAFLYASEPDIINPIAFAWDERGRLWVVQSKDYPHDLANDVGGDRITICEDTDGDGKADSFTDFATEQSLSTGIVIVKGGAIVAQAPEVVFLEDTDGDDKMDKRTLLFSGFGTWDTHAGPANFKWGHDNQIWGSVGYSGFEYQFPEKKIEFTRGVFRFQRDGSMLEPLGQFNNNTWGLGITEDFEIFGSTANNNHACYVGIPLRYYDHLPKHPSWAISADFIQGHYEIYSPDTIPLQQVDVRGGYTAAAGSNFYTGSNYPSKYRGQMYVNEPTGHLVHLAQIVEDGAGYKEVDGGNIFASTDAWTAPVYTETGPDGNLWIADWYNPVIQHNPDKRGMDNQIWNANAGPGNAHLNPLRDKGHGRIYILKHKSGKASPITSLDANDPSGLLKGLASDNQFWRITAQRLIVENDIQGLVPQLIDMAGGSDLGAAHALWALDGLGTLKGENEAANQMVEKALSNKSEALRKTALSLLPNSPEGSAALLKANVLNDKNPYVRRNAILRASELPETDELYQAIKLISGQPQNQNDKWLNAALKIYFREQNTEDIEAEEVVMVIPTAEGGGTAWRYTTKNPSSTWMNESFDDSAWETGESVFGKVGSHPAIKTDWTTRDIWMRKEVELEEAIQKPVLKVVNDEGYEVYVNGQLLFEEASWRRNYKYFRLDPSTSSLFKAGKNVIAVHCINENGNQHIDVGIGKVGDFQADRSFVLNTVPSKMAYDQTKLYAMAGEKLEIVLNNTDEMPHNLVLIERGSLDDFGKIVDKFLESPEAAKQDYVPGSRYVLGATKMVDPGENDVLRIKLPEKPGVYPFICTFPGHWRLMQGVIYVSPRGSYVSSDPNALRITGMGGGSSHDFLKFFAIADGKVLSQGGTNTFTYTESSAELNSLLDKTDILFMTNNKAHEAATQSKIFQRVNEGMPMIIYHPSIWYNWENWPRYNKELVGGGSRSHEKLQEFEVRVTKPNHPIMKGVPRTFRIVDELYRFEKDPKGPKIEVLAVGKGLESGEEFPVVWIVKHRKARIVCNTLGHDARAHGLDAYQKMLSNTLDWVKRRLRRAI